MTTEGWMKFMVINRPATSRKDKSKQINMTMDLRTFNILCKYILSSSAYLRINHLVNLNKLIYVINPETY